ALWVAWPSERREVASGETEAPAPRELAAPDEPAPPAESPLLSPVVTLAVGSAARIESDGPVPLEAGEVLREGQALRIGEDGALHVRLADGTGFAAAAGTELTIARAREDAVELALSAGRIDNTVARLASGSTYTVLCAGYRIEVRGTRFVVSFVDGVVGVDVAEGGVVVRNDDAEPVELSAPARWRSEGSAEGEPEIVAPRGLEAASGALSPVTIAHGELVRWEIDGTSFAGRGPVRLLFRDGEHEVRGWDRRGRLHTALVPVRGAAVAIEPSALVPEGPRMRPGHLPPEEITRVLRRANATERVRACYERTLRDHPEVYGRLRVRVSVGVMGDVQRVSVQGAAASEATQLSECIERVASQWTFPPPGGPVTFELPLAFSSRP
ncbi:MAG TPA: AgmX/PglI C-terminal domain-containing protein, partial [Sandaracinaceae bacterium]